MAAMLRLLLDETAGEPWSITGLTFPVYQNTLKIAISAHLPLPAYNRQILCLTYFYKLFTEIKLKKLLTLCKYIDTLDYE